MGRGRGQAGLRAALLGLLALGSGCGAPLHRVSPETLSVALRAHDVVELPDRRGEGRGDGPFPTVLLVPGCRGAGERERSWARDFAAAGWAAVTLDSFSGRGLAGAADLGATCRRGQGPDAAERAGDVLVSLADLRARPFVDAGRLAAIGWAEGGRAILEALAFAASGQPPPNLTRLPAGALAGLRAVALLYPRCDPRGSAWPPGVPGVLLLARPLSAPAAGPDPCQRMAVALAERGAPVRVVVYPAAPGFDDPVPPELRAASGRAAYDAGAAADARARVGALFAERWRPPVGAGAPAGQGGAP